jgi:hypothetical protein
MAYSGSIPLLSSSQKPTFINLSCLSPVVSYVVDRMGPACQGVSLDDDRINKKDFIHSSPDPPTAREIEPALDPEIARLLNEVEFMPLDYSDETLSSPELFYPVEVPYSIRRSRMARRFAFVGAATLLLGFRHHGKFRKQQ